ncbi:hypothetical protein LCGC14_0879340 [marine sediment metagenome]|uniref:Uncharacterized protein n=1 Tax=marine sediment metagenome TaxID=412755 RepID=A0A0F9P2C9_9ZZZZ
MSDWPVKKNATFELQFPMYDADGDLVSAAASLDTEVSKDGGTFTDATNEAAEIATASGCYKITLTSTEMNADRVMTITKTGTAGAKTAVNLMYTAVRQLIDLAFPATSGRSFVVETDGVVHGDLKEWLGVAPAALVSQRVDVTVGAMQANVLDATAIASAAITAAKFGTDAIDAAAVAADAVDLIWDEPLAGHLTLASIGQLVNALGLTGAVADAGALATDFDTDGFTEATNNHFNGHVIVFTSGALRGQARIITTYTGAGQNVAFDRAFTEAPANNDEFVILGPLAGGLGRLIATESDGHAHADVKEWLGAAPNVLVSSRVDVSVGAMAADVVTAAAIANAAIDAATFAAGAIDAAAIANGAIDAATFAAGAIDAAAIANGAIDAATFAAGAIDAGALAADAANEIADAVFQRDMDAVEAGAPKHSLASAVLKAVSRIRDNAGSLEVYRTDGTTIHFTQVVTTDAGLDPIDELAVGV